MEHKKKYHGGLNLLLLPLFIMLLGIFSTCYAVEYPNLEFCDVKDMTEQHILAVSEILYSHNPYGTSGAFYTWLKNNQNKRQDLVTALNSIMTTEMLNSKISNLVFIDKNGKLYILFNNNSYNENFAFIRLETLQSSGSCAFGYRDENSSIFINGYNYILIPYGSNAFYTPTLETSINDLIDSTGSRPSINSDNIHFNYSPLCCFGKIGNINEIDFYLNTYSNITTFNWYYPNTDYIVETKFTQIEPEEPSGDTGGSGDSGGGTVIPSGDDSSSNIDYTNQLKNINNNITNIQNQISGDSQRIIDKQTQNTQTIVNTISGEVQKITNTLTESADIDNTIITSGDIQGSLGFDFMADPYANFWFEMTQGLSTALTGSVRQLPIDWLGYQGVLDLDKLGFNYPPAFKVILTSVSTVSMVWVLVKWWKIIIDKLTSGNMDEVLAMNEEERHY